MNIIDSDKKQAIIFYKQCNLALEVKFMSFIDRPFYLDKLIRREKNTAIKVITGIRRSGKSTLLFHLFYKYLINKGIRDDQIIKISLDDDEIKDLNLLNSSNLRKYIESKITSDEDYYLFIDEIQVIDGFEFLLNGLNRKENLDIYVTGSNSKFLSKDVITEFRGRGDEVKVYPLSFKEFYSNKNLTFEKAWQEYYIYGGFPFLITKDLHEDKRSYLNSLFELTYIKDVLNRHRLNNMDIFNKLIDVLSSSIGSYINVNKIVNTFISSQTNVTKPTISRYIEYLEDAFIISKAKKYDVKGRKYIYTPFKLYFSDVGLRNSRLEFRQLDEGHLMENIVYNELIMRGFNVDVGAVKERKQEKGEQTYKQLEVDFVCNKAFKRYYIQVAVNVYDEDKYHREVRSLQEIDDSFRKILIVKDIPITHINQRGVEMLKLEDFLLNEDIL